MKILFPACAALVLTLSSAIAVAAPPVSAPAPAPRMTQGPSYVPPPPPSLFRSAAVTNDVSGTLDKLIKAAPATEQGKRYEVKIEIREVGGAMSETTPPPAP